MSTEPRSRLRAAAVVTLVGTGLLAPITAPTATAAGARWDISLAAEDIIIDIVRHGDDQPPADARVPFSPQYPGAGISALGEQEAAHTASQLYAELGDKIAGFFSGPDTDVQETAAAFGKLVDMHPQILNGLVEVDGGIFANQPTTSIGGLYYDAATVLWMLGLVNTLMIPDARDYNGVIVDDKYTADIDTMYHDAMGNPVVAPDGKITDVAYSSEAATMIWTILNVKNPDPIALIDTVIASLKTGGELALIPNAGVVQIEGNPTDGWTLLDWAGHKIPTNPGVLGDAFLIWRDLVFPEQAAFDHVLDAVASGSSTELTDAFHDGFVSISAALDDIPATVDNLFADIETGTW